MTVTDTEYLCEACVDGDHDECNTKSCACIDMEPATAPLNADAHTLSLHDGWVTT